MASKGFQPDFGSVLHHPLRVGAMRPTPIIEIGCAGIDTAATVHIDQSAGETKVDRENDAADER